MKNRYYISIPFTVFIFVGLALFTSGGCGGIVRGLIGACTETIEDPPDPEIETCRIIPEGIGEGIVYCTDEFGKDDWDMDSPNVYKELNKGIENIIFCMEGKLDANIHFIVEPGIFPPVAFEKEAKKMNMSGGADLYAENEAQIYPDEFPLEEYCRFEPDNLACITEEPKAEIARAKKITVTIPAEFAVILIDKDACIVKKDVWGVTLYDKNNNPRIWLNRMGQLWQHELTHLFATEASLSDQEEESLESCTPEINHHPL